MLQQAGTSEGVVEGAQDVLTTLKQQSQEVNRVLSLTKDGKEGKSNMGVSKGYLRREHNAFCGEDGVGTPDSIEYPGIDKKDKCKEAGKESRRKTAEVEAKE